MTGPETKSRSLINRVLQSRIFMVLLLILAVAAALQLSNELARRSKINKEIGSLRGQIASLKREQGSLSTLENYLSTDAYIEQEARSRLNVGQPGEHVVIIGTTRAEISSNTKPMPSEQFRDWWDYFFSYEN